MKELYVLYDTIISSISLIYIKKKKIYETLQYISKNHNEIKNNIKAIIVLIKYEIIPDFRV